MTTSASAADSLPLPVTVRAASARDYEAAVRLYRTYLGDEFVLNAALWEAFCGQESHRALVAETADGRVVGLVTVVVTERIRLATSTRRHRFHVDDLVVDPDLRRRGIAKALLAETVAMARAERPSYLIVSCDFTNVAARRTYEAAGLSLVRQNSDRFELAFS
jgi:Acetyltransferases